MTTNSTAAFVNLASGVHVLSTTLNDPCGCAPLAPLPPNTMSVLPVLGTVGTTSLLSGHTTVVVIIVVTTIGIAPSVPTSNGTCETFDKVVPLNSELRCRSSL